MTNILSIPSSITSLLLGMGIVLVGNGLLGTALGLRAGDEHYSDSVIGILMALYFLGFILGTFLCPRLIERVGHIRTFSALASIGGAISIIHALIVHPVAWFVLRVISGICLVGLYIVLESWLNEQSSNENRGRILAIYMTVVLLALGLGQFLILLDTTFGFVTFGLVSILFCLGLVPITITRLPEPAPVRTPDTGLGHLYRISSLGLAGAGVAGLTGGAFWAVGAVFAQHIGLTHAGIAAFMGTTIFGGVLLQWPIGLLSDHYDRRLVLMLTTLSCALFALVALILSWHFPAAFIMCMFFYGGTSFSLYALSVAHVNDRLDDSSRVVEISCGLLLIYGLGATIGPVMAGILMEVFGARSLLAFFAVTMAILGIFALFRIRQQPPVPAYTQGSFVPLVRTSQVSLEMQPRANQAD